MNIFKKNFIFYFVFTILITGSVFTFTKKVNAESVSQAFSVYIPHGSGYCSMSGTVSLDKSSYLPGEQIVASGIISSSSCNAPYVLTSSWINVTDQSNGGNQQIIIQYNASGGGAGTGSIIFNASNAPGSHSIYFTEGFSYINGSNNSSETNQTLLPYTINVTPNSLPEINLPVVTNITTTTATVGATVTSLGNPPSPFTRGTCLGTSPNPSLTNGASCIPNGSQLGSFTSIRGSLIPGTEYHYRGYATNSTGTSYTNNISFTTNGPVLVLSLNYQQKNLVAKNKPAPQGESHLVAEISGLPLGRSCSLQNNEQDYLNYNNLQTGVEISVSNLPDDINIFRLFCDDVGDEYSNEVKIYAQSGSLIVPGTCTIPVNGTTCQSQTISWETINPDSGSPTAIFQNDIQIIQTSNNGSSSLVLSGDGIPNGGTSQTITFDSRNRVDGETPGSSVPITLATSSTTVSCAFGSTWIGGKCTPSVINRPDLIASGITPTTAVAGIARTFTSTITNQGNADTDYEGINTFSNLFQRASVLDDANQPIVDLEWAVTGMGILDSNGGDANTSKAITFASAGTYYLRVCADKNSSAGAGVISESNEGNNCGDWVSIQVTTTAKPDLTAGATTPSLAVVNVGRTYTSTIRNQGTASTGVGFQNTFQTATGFDDPTSFLGPENLQSYNAPSSMSALGIGASATATSPTITFSSPGNYYMRACADIPPANPGTVNNESNENNNCGPWSIVSVGASVTVDLRASDPTQNSATIGIPINFTSIISNQGNTTTGNSFYNTFQIAAEANGGGTLTRISSTPSPMPTLAPGGLATATSVSYTFTGLPTTRSVRACADINSLGNGQITELPVENENNNCSSWVNINLSNTNTTGTLSATNCQIESGASTCKTSLNWNTVNPVSGGMSAVTTTPNNTIVRTSLSGSNFLYDISHGSRNFYLYHSLPTPTLLAQAQATATCQVATDVWADGKCNPAGVSSGNLTINPLSCDIAQNESTCTVTGATWTTTNAIQPSLVDENTGTVLSTSANNSDPLRIWVAYPQTDFALRHTGFPGVLDTERVTAKCVNGTSWVDGKCVAILGGLSGSIDALDCTILEGESTCLSNISWSTINPILGETSSVTTPVNITIADENNGDKSYEMDRGSRYFYLYHNGLELGRDESIAECINGTSWVDGKCTFSGGGGGDPIDGLCGYPHNDCDAGTSFDLQDSVNTYMWQCLGQSGGNDSPICTENIVGGGSGDTIDIDFTANPKRIFKGRSSTLRWVTDADSCTGTANDGSPFVTEDKPNGTYIVKPNQTTVYTLSCKKTGVSDASQDAEVKVSVIKFFEI